MAKTLFKIKGPNKEEAFKVLDTAGVASIFIDGTEVTSTAAELSLNHLIMSTATVALSTGAANSVDCTITVQDAAGSTIAAVHDLEVFISRGSDGATGLTSTAASGALTASTGVVLTALTAKKHIMAVTNSSGVLVLNLVDTAKTQNEYFCVKVPRSGKIVASAATVTGNYG